MTPIHLPRPLPVLLLLLASLAVGEVPARAQDLPNIVIVLADDLGSGDLRSYNPQSRIPTPHLDRLAEQGMRFTDAHAPGSWCTPSRYGLLTGLYPSRLPRMNWQERSLIQPGQTTLASLLKESGFTTAMVGKWHLGFDGGMDCVRPLRGGPVDHGFEHFFGIHASTDIPPYFYIRGDGCVAAPTSTIEASTSEGDVWNDIQGAFWRAGPIAPGLHLEGVLPRLREEAVAFLEDHHRERRDRPFFLYLALPAPHTPWLPLPEFQGVSGAGMYGDFTAQVDDLFGEVTTTLERLGYGRNTLVIFSSDNGPVWYPKDAERFGHRSSHVYRGMKFDLWEGGHRMPFLARWPGRIPAGSVSDALLSFTDLLSTFAAVLGRDLPEGTGADSQNLLPVLLGAAEARPIRNTMVHYARQGDLAIRQGQWKLIPAADGGELYNLEEDIAETRNLYRERPEVVQRLRAALDNHRSRSTGLPQIPRCEASERRTSRACRANPRQPGHPRPLVAEHGAGRSGARAGVNRCAARFDSGCNRESQSGVASDPCGEGNSSGRVLKVTRVVVAPAASEDLDQLSSSLKLPANTRLHVQARLNQLSRFPRRGR